MKLEMQALEAYAKYLIDVKDHLLKQPELSRMHPSTKHVLDCKIRFAVSNLIADIMTSHYQACACAFNAMKTSEFSTTVDAQFKLLTDAHKHCIDILSTDNKI